MMWSADDEDTVLIEWLDGSAVDCQKETKHIRTARIATEHICPMDMRKDVELDEETEKLLANGTYKKCPNCGIYIQKNDGCNFMMCGAYAHGKISDAIKNGGCGHIFYWDSLLPAHTHHENDVQVTP